MLDGAPDGDPVAVWRRHACVRLDREVGHDREGVGVLDHDVGGGGVHVAPAEAVLSQDVRGRQGVVGAECRVLDEVSRGVESCRDREDGGQLLVLDLHLPGCLFGSILRLGRDRRDRLAVVLRLADGDDRAVDELGSKARDRLGQVRGRHDEPDAGHPLGGTGVDRDDPSARDRQRDEPDLQDVLQPDVRDVLLTAGDAADATGPVGRAADPIPAHRSAPSAVARTASVICW